MLDKKLLALFGIIIVLLLLTLAGEAFLILSPAKPMVVERKLEVPQLSPYSSIASPSATPTIGTATSSARKLR